MNALILGKKIVGRKETLEYAANKFNWKDTVIGISAFYAFWAWILARLTGRKFIYYCIDFYSPEIAYTLWDKIFIPCAMLMDRFLLQRADKNWVISERIREGRQYIGNYDYEGTQYVVPLAYPPSYFRFKNPCEKNWIAYVGITPYGFELLEGIENIHLLWIGQGKLVPLGELLVRLPYCGFGISLWKDKGNNYYGDPGKTKLYSACGLPVIMTDNTPYAKVIKDTMAGIVIKYDREELKKAIKEMLFNYDFYKRNVKDTWRYINADELYKDLHVLG